MLSCCRETARRVTLLRYFTTKKFRHTASRDPSATDELLVSKSPAFPFVRILWRWYFQQHNSNGYITSFIVIENNRNSRRRMVKFQRDELKQKNAISQAREEIKWPATELYARMQPQKNNWRIFITKPTPVGIKKTAICNGMFTSPGQSELNWTNRKFTARYDTRCYFNVRSKADMSQLNLPHGTNDYKV